MEVTDSARVGPDAERTRQELHDVFMQAPVALVVMSGPEHRFTLANPLYERLVHREVVGRTVREVFTSQEAAHIFPVIDRVYLTGEPYIWNELPISLPDADGVVRELFLNVSYTALRDSDQQVTAVACLVVDVTEQVRARNEVERARATLEVERANYARLFDQTSGFMAVVTGPEFVYEFLNPSNQQVLGGDFRGKRLREVIPDVESSGLIAVLERVYRTGNAEVIHELPLPIGRELRYFDATCVARRNAEGAIDGVMTWGMDTTSRVRARKRIEEVVDELRSERGMREHFVATLSHDLRTPLATCKLSARLLSKRAGDADAIRKIAVRIEDSVDRADNMVRDVLDANRIGAGETLHLEVEKCSLNAIATEVIEDLSLIHGDRFRLEASGPIDGTWSRSGLRRILENLSSNAIKYGDRERPIRIALRATHDTVIVEVHNEGVPIAPEHQKTLFQAYRRTESAISSGHGGWGIGLPLVKGLAEAHGGAVELASSPEEGTTFRVILPLDSSAAASAR